MAYSLRHRVYTTRRFRKAITPARHWQKRTDVVRVVARKHQKVVASKIKAALDHIAALAIHQHGAVRDVGHHLTLVKADWDESEHPRDEHGEFTTGSALPTTYTGSHADGGAGVVDNPLPRSKSVSIKMLSSPDLFSKPEGGRRDVPVRDLKTSQDYVNPKQVAEYQKPYKDRSFGTTINPVATIKVGGETVVVDGTHRLAAAIQRGDKTIETQSFGSWDVKDSKLTRSIAKAAVPLPDQGMQVNVTMPTSHEIQAQLKLVYDAVAVAAQEVAEKTASQIAAERGAAAAEKFMADWQTYMTGQIQQVTQEIQASIQQVMSAGAYAGLGPSTVARDVRDMIGLTERQQGYVESYRQSLENLTSDALDRALRSTSADAKVSAAIDDEFPLENDYVDRLVARYAENWRNYRADMIARTELITANNEGARAGMEAVIDAGTFDRLEVRRYWLVAMDEDTCQICLSIPELNPDGVGMDEEFQVDSEDGTIFAPTAHPNCRCSIAYKNVPNA